MKKLCAFVILIFLLAPSVWSQERCEAPVWNMGDKWIYKNEAGKIHTSEVIRVRDDVFILDTGWHYLSAYDKKTMNIKSFIDAYGTEVRADNTMRNLLDFPMFVGKKWSDGVTQWAGHCTA